MLHTNPTNHVKSVKKMAQNLQGKMELAGLLYSIPATTAMTMFSIVYSEATNRNYIEPEQLSKTIKKLTNINKPSADYMGWIAHYFVGFVFCSAYWAIWRNNTNKYIRKGWALGLASGIIGVSIWKLVFSFQKRKPAIETEYYMQLVAAHIIFGMVAKSIHRIKQ
jgi:glucan phosphoethanolaminetransferase (alkaline phosphatase superfamily)